MRIILRLFAVLVMSAFAINNHANTSAGFVASKGIAAPATPMSSTSAFTSMYGVQSFNTQSLNMFGTQSQVMYGSYTVPMAAQSISNGTTLTEDAEEQFFSHAHRALGGGGYRPDYDQDDPFHTPIGDVPLLLLILLAAGVTFVRIRLRKVDEKPAPALNEVK